MLHQQVKRKEKSVALQRGLYLLRYESAPDPAQPPMVTLTCDPTRCQAVMHPDQKRAVMTAPGQALVLRATEQSNVVIELSTMGDSRTLDATLKFEPLLQDSGVQFERAMAMPASTSAFAGSVQRHQTAIAPLRLLGHVARIGDVTVGSDEWLGGPQSPSRVEGFQIIWNGKPSNVELRYAATISGQRPGEALIANVGEFVGTRGKAKPIVGLMLELTGAGARDMHLEIETVFLNAPPRRSKGTNITVTGVTGREPLVGLRVMVAAAARQVAVAGATQYPAPVRAPPNYAALPAPYYSPTQQQQPAVSQPVVPATPDPRRVRVFRG